MTYLCVLSCIGLPFPWAITYYEVRRLLCAGPGSRPAKYLGRVHRPLQPSQIEGDTIEMAKKTNKCSFGDRRALQQMDRAGWCACSFQW